MHIGVDATAWQNRRGYGRHARALVAALLAVDERNRYTLVTDSPEVAAALPARATRLVVRAGVPTAVSAAADGHRSPADMWRMSRALGDPSFDILLFPTVYSYVPVFSRARKVIVFHDTIAETYPALTLPSRTARLFWKSKVAVGRFQAHRMVTVSHYSQQRLSKRFRIPADRIAVVGEASDPVFRPLPEPCLTPGLIAAGVRPGRRYAVFFGGFGPHKNVGRLVAAFAQLSGEPDLNDVDLILVGELQEPAFHSELPAIQRQVDALGLTSRAVFTGYLPDDELVALLNLATVSILPSLMEGFGLPAIEAAACGCPVIATRESPLPEILGEGGRYFDPLDTAVLATTLAEVLRSPALRQHMSTAGQAAAQRLSWEAAARQMLDVMQQVGPQ